MGREIKIFASTYACCTEVTKHVSTFNIPPVARAEFLWSSEYSESRIILRAIISRVDPNSLKTELGHFFRTTQPP